MQARSRLLGAVAGFGPPGLRPARGGVMTTGNTGSYEEWGCAACLSGRVYDGRAGSWVGCGACSGIGRALVFDYPKAGRPRGCAGCGDRFAGRELFEVGDDNLTFFEGDELCRGCTAGHGVL